MQKRKLMIVVEDTGSDNGKGFNVYLAGDVERLSDKSIPDDKLCPAEFWASRIFGIAIQLLQATGIVKDIKMPKGSVPPNAH